MNPFNFADVSDIAAVNPELAGKVANQAQDKINSVVSIFAAAAAAGAGALTISQLQIAAIRMAIELPADATVRKYINDAIKQGSVVKVTRQSYAAVEAGVAVEADADEEDTTVEEEAAVVAETEVAEVASIDSEYGVLAAEAADDADPLAGL